MPELPEVETLRLGLQKYLIGRKIVGVEVKDHKIWSGDEKLVVGAKFKAVRRYGKGIVMDLSNGYSIAVHIKLTGQLIYRDEKTKDHPVSKPFVGAVPNKFTRVIFHLDRDAYLYFNEVRRFAWMKVLPTDKVRELPFFKNLGPEPMPSPGSNTPKLTTLMFRNIIANSNLPIKVLLMDQKKIGGIGNIYANEACWDAQIDPRKRAKTLSETEINRLYKSIFKVLELGLKYRGSSELNFVDVLGRVGEFQNHVKAYGQKGKRCSRCGEIFKKIYLGGRGTYFCPTCQN